MVVWYKTDRWDRLVGVVWCDGKDTNLNMIDRGMAWHFKRYAHEQSPDDREAYSAAEIAAQASRRGLWSDPDPVPPWEWRKKMTDRSFDEIQLMGCDVMRIHLCPGDFADEHGNLVETDHVFEQKLVI